MPTSTGIKTATFAYTILYVKDTEKASKFYTEKLGLKIKMSHPGWVEFETGATTLALHATEKPLAHKGTDNSPVSVFHVEDIHEATKQLKADGITLSKELQEVCEEGDKVGLCSDFEDTDGNRLSLFGFVPKK